MPEVPQLKKFPYTTEKPCRVCHPSDREEPPNMECVSELSYAGAQVQRVLRCPNCGEQDADIFDARLGRVTFDKRLDMMAAMGQGRGPRNGDIG